MKKISRWQVFERDHGDVVICKSCNEMIEYDEGKMPEKLSRRCPKCGAIMVGRSCWFAPKE